MSEQLSRRLSALELAVEEDLPLLVVLEEPTDEQRRQIAAAERAGSCLWVIRVVFG